MLEKLTGTKVTLQKVERARRRRGTLSPLLCAVALGSCLDASVAYALEVPSEAAMDADAELLPVTLNPPGDSLVFGADEPCLSVHATPADDAAANVQMDAAGRANGTQLEPEESLLEATGNGRCVTLASFAAAGEPFFAAHAAASGFGFSATLGQMAMFAGVPAAIAKAAQAVGKRKGKGGDRPLPGPGDGPGRGPGGGVGGPGAGGGPGGQPPTPTPEPASTLLLVAGAALVGRAVQRRRR